MKSRIEKPVLYLPTRILIVPCDYDPDPHGPVKWIEQTMTLRYETDEDGRFRSVTKGTYVAREVVKKEPMTFFGAPIRFV